MSRLKDRNRQIPNGLFFYVPQTKWRSQPWASFDTIVHSLIAHRQGNKFLADKFGWSTDYDVVADEVDAFNSRVCEQMGWNQFITGEGGLSPPISSPPQLSGLNKLAAGARVLVEWITSGAEAVPIERANLRAATCAICPLNGPGDWTRYFTQPVSNAIAEQLKKRRNMNLSTPSDDKLGICTACLCPLKLKVHVPIDKILARLKPEVKADLDPACWILLESR